MDGKLIGLVRDTLIRRYGENLWESLSSPAPSDPDGVPSDALACWLGRESVPAVRDRYPSLFTRHPDLMSFITGLGDELPAVGERSRGDVPITFRHGIAPDGQVLLRIQAPCSICALVQGVIAGAAVHYGENVTIHELKSRKRGDNVCVLQLELGGASFSPDSRTGPLAAIGSA